MDGVEIEGGEMLLLGEALVEFFVLDNCDRFEGPFFISVWYDSLGFFLAEMGY